MGIAVIPFDDEKPPSYPLPNLLFDPAFEYFDDLDPMVIHNERNGPLFAPIAGIGYYFDFFGHRNTLVGLGCTQISEEKACTLRNHRCTQCEEACDQLTALSL